MRLHSLILSSALAGPCVCSVGEASPTARSVTTWAADQCRIILGSRPAPSKLDDRADIIDRLDRIFRAPRYRRGALTVIGDDVLIGWTSRQFTAKSSFHSFERPRPRHRAIFPVVPRDREGGLREIIAGLDQADASHAWIYLAGPNVWVDVTMAAPERSVYMDPTLIEGLHDHFGPIEILHTRPPKISMASWAHVRTPLHHLVTGALPTTSELMSIIDRAWNLDRTIGFTEGIIHPHGITYFAVTEHLLRSTYGPPVTDALNLPTQLIRHVDDPRVQIGALAHVQAAANVIPGLREGEVDRPAFRIKAFSREQFGQIDAWLVANGASLSESEAATIARRRNDR